MPLKKLPLEIQSLLNAASKIRCFNKAVEELVYNSLDAKASSIAIRINIHDSFIQVVDNGSGIPKSDILLLGQRYTSSKITDTSAFKGVPDYYGFHGESLSNIIETSKCVKITTRYKEQEDTWVKYFCNGQHKDSYTTQRRPSKGTTVEVKGFLYNLHIPKETTNELNELEKIKSFLQKAALVKTNTSFSIRDNYSNEIIFQMHKNRDIYQTLYSLFEIEEKDLQELQIEKNLYKAKGFIGKQIGEPKSYRWIFLNGRFIYKSVLHDIVNLHFMPNRQLYNDTKEKHYTYKYNIKKNVRLNLIPSYFIFISCPYFDYDINFTSLKTNIEFGNWTQIELLLEKLVKFYKGDVKIKEMETEQPKKKRKVENTREEVKKIMEKVLGTKSNNQILMHKVVKGKVTKTKLKNKEFNNKFTSKICKILSSQNRVTKDNIFACQKSPSTKNNYLPLCNNLQAQKFNTSKKNSQMEKKSINEIKKSMKNSKEKIKKISECCINSGIQYHVKEGHPVKKKKSLKNVENINIKLKRPVNLGIGFHVKEANSVIRKKKYRDHKNFNVSNSFNPLQDNIFRKYDIKRNNIVKLQKPGHDVSRNKHEQLAVYINQNNLRPLKKVTNECLKSSDLVKTILNSQRGYSPCIRNDTIYYTSKHMPSENIRQFALSDEMLAHANNIKFNVLTAYNAKLTYESHNYSKDGISKYYQSIKKMDKFITEKFKGNPALQNNIKETLNNATTNKKDLKQNLHKNVQYSKCDGLSQVIEFTNSYRTVNYFETSNKVPIFNKHQSTAHDQYKITCSVQNTYTIQNSKISSDIASYTNNIIDKTRDEFDGATFSYHGNVISSNISKETENCGIQSSKMNKIEENNIEVIFISNSKNSTTHQLIEGIVPLNICEAVYQNTQGSKQTGGINDMDTNVDIHKDETMNQNINFNKSPDLQKVNEDNLSQLIDQTESVSHHFRKINNDLNMNRNELSSNLSQGHRRSIEPPEIITNCINYENKYVSNKFKLQNRNHFVPKGMSPIFENCQTKNICSYNLEMDYFEDDLYHNFANDVLVNFKIFEKGITNVNDIGPRNLNRHHVSLKFTAQSLKHAKVFGQVDKKFILAELRRDSLNTKHLVLFDQHAVHERIRLENNLSEYKNGEQWTSVNCEKISLKLSKDIILYMNNFREKIEQFGLRWRIDNECVVTVSAIPKALFGKHCREPDIVLNSIKSLILEEIKAIKSLGGNVLLYPKSIMDLVFSEACRNAIKFGDKLSKTECAMLISSLSNCNTPFQCAHGRPVMAVLLDLKNPSCDYKVDKSKIITFRNKTTT